jgi:hypothetical protein
MGIFGLLLKMGLFLTVLVWGGLMVLLTLLLFWPIGVVLLFLWLILLAVIN